MPLAGFTLYNEFTPGDIAAVPKFFDGFTERKSFTQTLSVKSLIYAG